MVRVHLSVDHGAAIRSVAERMGVRAMTDGALEHGASVGDVEIPDGAPDWLIEAAFLRALAPRHILFLCVANSARSQMAEGLARHLAPSGVEISSAGSEPGGVRAHAVAALSELDIDASDQRSKGVAEVRGVVDAVITLCEEEVCPVWLGDAWRVHWALPDPAAVTGTTEEELSAFRAVRDEIRRRLSVLFTGSVASPS